MTKVSPFVKHLVAEILGKHLEIGMITTHPKTGKKVKIVSGQYWGYHGVSNFWEWRNVNSDGTLGKLQSGYGWDPSVASI